MAVILSILFSFIKMRVIITIKTVETLTKMSQEICTITIFVLENCLKIAPPHFTILSYLFDPILKPQLKPKWHKTRSYIYFFENENYMKGYDLEAGEL